MEKWKNIIDIYDFYDRYVNIINNFHPYIMHYDILDNCDITSYLNLCNYNIVLVHNNNLSVYEIPLSFNDINIVHKVYEFLRNKCLKEYSECYFVEYDNDFSLKLVSKVNPKDIIKLNFFSAVW